MNKKDKGYVSISTYNEAIKTLRTNLLFSNIDKKLKTIVITSSVPNEGKSTIAVELGRSFAQTDKKVLIVDLDLRNASVKKAAEVDSVLGLTNIIIGDFKLEDVITKDSKEENLDLLLSGPKPPNPAELISSNALKEIIEKAKSKYDYILIDTPPVSVFTDAAIVSTFSDGILFVVKQKSTKKEAINRAITNIKNVNGKIIGTILTMVKMDEASYSDYYSKYYSKQ